MSNKISLSYVEALLLSTQSISAFTLHQQYKVCEDQANQISRLSSDLVKVSNELITLKTTNMHITQQVSSRAANTFSLSDIYSYIDPKLVLLVAGVGTIYYYVIPAITGVFSLSSLKSIFVPFKTSLVSMIPFLNQTKIHPFQHEGNTYTLKMIGDTIISLEVRKPQWVTDVPVSDIVNQTGNFAKLYAQVGQKLALPPSEPVSLSVDLIAAKSPAILSASQIVDKTAGYLSALT